MHYSIYVAGQLYPINIVTIAVVKNELQDSEVVMQRMCNNLALEAKTGSQGERLQGRQMFERVFSFVVCQLAKKLENNEPPNTPQTRARVSLLPTISHQCPLTITEDTEA